MNEDLLERINTEYEEYVCEYGHEPYFACVAVKWGDTCRTSDEAIEFVRAKDKARHKDFLCCCYDLLTFKELTYKDNERNFVITEFYYFE